ncbi:GNAT family N-acetyltransferase [Gordonia sp. HNM0687]|uniref:GNAT family N-acetyltransferase n=1 Tax=Gordonia mangrovi TaxID=2665643 RepID=A0A6L7GT23_9ACTN|nr:N-acetyltransferase [Gordonia mangrovi]MDY6810504.1 N-acetyltransferase [Actinomycetota bacterium]MXP23060.1 GNAT family N-acetyltransferase [Gordonia mangrovi]UVF77349.1 N-acetyltransferase [Gordonia mangrovi]
MDGRDQVVCRPEVPADIEGIRALVTAAFGQPDEADLVDALRADGEAWIPELSVVATDVDDRIVGYALVTRCRVGGEPALALAPCAVTPRLQNRGVGTAVTADVLRRARVTVGVPDLVVVLGHPGFYPRFGFRRASDQGISVSFEVSDEALMYLDLDPGHPIASGEITYPAAFGV